MSAVTTSCRLADLASTVPGATEVLDRFGLDYCGSGQERLDRACESGGIYPDSVLQQLVALPSGPPPEWAALPPSRLIEHIEEVHHAHLRAELPRLTAVAENMVASHRDLSEVASVFAELRSELEAHINREERVLFSAIRELDRAATMPTFSFGSVSGPISVMLADHRRTAERFGRLHALMARSELPERLRPACTKFADDLAAVEADCHLHTHKENNLLFPAAVRLEHRLSSSSMGGR